jgi:hypothetical protein
MKKNFKISTVVITVVTLVFLFNQCGASEEKKGNKVGDTKQAAVQEVARDQEKGQTKESGSEEEKKERKKIKFKLPKKLTELGLTDEQKVKCEAAYKEIYTPEIIAKRKEFWSKLKSLEKGSDEYKKMKKEVAKELRPYKKQYNAKLKEILTEEQKEKYFKKDKDKNKKEK